MVRVRRVFGWAMVATVAMAAVGCSSAARVEAEPITTAVSRSTAVTVSEPFEAPKEPPRIQVALLLDTSGSMNGLIKQAQAQLWTIVNEFVTMKRDGMRPEVEVALFQYGSDKLPSSEGWMRMVMPLSRDLDQASEELFKMTANGDTELCGQVIRMAVDHLAWSRSSNDLKVIFIAGNEEFTQGKVDYRESCKAAIAKGIVVNTIYCGDINEGARSGWKDGADLADGSYCGIDKDSRVAHLETPQDKKIAELSKELNTTYVEFGPKGDEGKKRQEEQDKNVAGLGVGSDVERAVAKASVNYDNAAWDLVDAVKNDEIKIEEVKVEALPEPMKTMNVEQRKEYVEQQAGRRSEIQREINTLNLARLQYLADQQKDAAAPGADATLGAAVSKTVNAQAAERGFAQEK